MRTISFLCLTVVILCVGCATEETPLSPMQKRQITTKQVEGSYENVYRAAMTVSQDQGYIVKNTDMDSGLIVASIDRETSKSSQFWQEFWVGEVYDKGTFIELTLTVGKINEALQEMRMTLQEARYDQRGGKTDIKQILDPKIYQELANQITVEVKRREALGR
jgi:hypothetical protein